MKLGKILGTLLVLLAIFSVMGCPEPEVPYVEEIINVEKVFLEVSTSEEGVNVTITLPDELVGKDVTLLNICRNAPEFKLEYSEMKHQDFWNYNNEIEENYLYARWYSYDDYISKASYTFVDNFVNSDTEYSYSCYAVVDGSAYYSKNYKVTTKTVKYGEFSSYKPDLSNITTSFDVQKYDYSMSGSFTLKDLPENWYNDIELIYSNVEKPGREDLFLDYDLFGDEDGTVTRTIGMTDDLKSEYKNKRLTLQWIKQILFYELPEEESVNNYFIYENPDKDYIPPYEDLYSYNQFISQTLEKPANILPEILTYVVSLDARKNLVGIYSDTNSILEFLDDETVTLNYVGNDYGNLPFTKGTYEILSDKRVIIKYNERTPSYDDGKSYDYCSCELTEYGLNFYEDDSLSSYSAYYKKQDFPNDISTVGKWSIETNSTNLDLIINNDDTYYIIDMKKSHSQYKIYEKGTVTQDMNFYNFTGNRVTELGDYVDVTYFDIQNSEGGFISRIHSNYPFEFVTEQTFHEAFYYDKWFDGEYSEIPLKLWSDDLKYVLYIGWERNNNSGTFYDYDEYRIYEVILDEEGNNPTEKSDSYGSFKIISEDSALFTKNGESEGETVVMSDTGVITVEGKNFLIDTGKSIEGTWVHTDNSNVKFISNGTEEKYQWINTEKEEYISLGYCHDCRWTSSNPSGFSLGWVFWEENVDYYAIPVSETTLYIADLINNKFEVFEKESDNSELPYGYSGEDKLKDTGFISKDLKTVITNIDRFTIYTYCGPDVSGTSTNDETEYYYINENKVQVFIPEINYSDTNGSTVSKKIFSRYCIEFTSENSFTYQEKEYFKAQQFTADEMIGTWSDGEVNTIKFSKDGEYDKCEFRTYNDYYYVEDRGWDFLGYISIPNISFIGDGAFSEVFEGVLSYDGTLCVSTGFENPILYLKKQQ